MPATATHTARQWPALPVQVHPQPARIVAVAQLLIDVLADLSIRPPETLSASEADLQAFFVGGENDLHDILFRARDEMGAAAVTILRTGGVCWQPQLTYGLCAYISRQTAVKGNGSWPNGVRSAQPSTLTIPTAAARLWALQWRSSLVTQNIPQNGNTPMPGCLNARHSPLICHPKQGAT